MAAAVLVAASAATAGIHDDQDDHDDNYHHKRDYHEPAGAAPRSHLPSTECRHGILSCALHSLRGPGGFLPADLAVAHDPPETESSRGSRRLHGACPPRGGRPGRSLAGAVTRVRDGGDRLVVGAGNPRSNAPSGDPALTMPRRRHAVDQHGVCESVAVASGWLLSMCCRRILRTSWAS